MDVVSACPLPVASLLWQTPARGTSLAVVCKATYQLRPIESPLADEQDAPNERDVYRHDDPGGSLRLASDLAPFKRRADVLLVGHAYAPRGEAVRSLRVRLVVGEVDKSFEVFADRAFTLEGQIREGSRFTQMPLLWRRAAGGPETSNPSGVRADAPPDSFGLRPLPNLQPLGLHVTSPNDLILPVGFGPIAPTWPGRWDKLRHHAAGWDPQRWHERPLPDDIDPGYFNAALPDQQVEAIRPNERLVLENLHPEQERLVTSLATATPRARVEWAGGGAEDVRFRCDTIWIDTDRRSCSLTWRAQIPIDHPDRLGRVTVTLTQGERRRWSGLTMGTSSMPAPGAELPFGQGAGGAPPPMSAPPEFPAPGHPEPPTMPLQARVDRTQDGPLPGAMPVLPFRVGRSPLSGSVLGRLPSAEPDVPVKRSLRSPTLPFAASPAPPTPPPAAPDLADLPFARSNVDPVSDFEDSDEVTMDHDPWQHAERELPTMDLPLPAAPLPYVALDAPPPAPPPYVALDATPPAPPPYVALDATPPAPPPLLGPLATLEMLTAPPAPPEPETSAPPEEAPAPKAAPPAEEERAPQVELPLARYPLLRCAAIAASIARRRADAAAILEENQLAAPVWTALDKHWAEAIRAESSRGKASLLKAYDAAYVGRLEEERGLLEVRDYARLTVATERGTVNEVLVELGLPKGALLRIMRLWLGKITADPVLAGQVRAAVEREREA